MSKRFPRVVELLRVSTLKQAKAGTPDAQRRVLAEMREERPGKVIKVILAEDVSGKLRLSDSKQGRELEELAAQGFDELRVVDIDRVFGSRAEDPRDRFGVWALLKEAGALLIDEFQVLDPKSTDDERKFYERTLYARIEREKILRRTRRGRRATAARGNVHSRPKYGFTREKLIEASLSKSTPPVIDPETADVVREIYELRLAGTSIRKIGIELFKRGVPSPGTGTWPDDTVLRILKDTAYRGEYMHDGSVIEVDPIIDANTWELVQKIGARSGRPRRKSTALCGGLIKCSCGRSCYSMPGSGKRDFYYGCATFHSTAQGRGGELCEHAKRHNREAVDAAVWASVFEAITDPKVLKSAISADTDEPRADLEGYREELARCEELIARSVQDEVTLGREYRRRTISEQAWIAQLNDIARERKLLDSSAELARQQIRAGERQSNTARLASIQLDALRERIVDAPAATRRAIIEAIIPKQAPYGVVLSGDGMIEVVGVLPVADSDEGKGSVATGAKHGKTLSKKSHAAASCVSL